MDIDGYIPCNDRKDCPNDEEVRKYDCKGPSSQPDVSPPEGGWSSKSFCVVYVIPGRVVDGLNLLFLTATSVTSYLSIKENLGYHDIKLG